MTVASTSAGFASREMVNVAPSSALLPAMSEQSRRGSRELLLEILDALDVGVLVTDEGHEILFANEQAREGLARTGHDVAALLRCAGVRLPASTERFSMASPVRIDGRIRYHVRARRLARSGPRRWVLTLARHVERGLDADLVAFGRRHGLGHRDCEIVAQLKAGRRNREVASALGLSVATVEWYLSRIYAAVGVRGRAELLAVLFAAPPGDEEPR